MRVMSSFSTKRSSDWLSLRVFTRYCSRAESSIPAYFFARWPQNDASAESHSETFCPSSLSFSRPSANFSTMTKVNASYPIAVRYLNASVTGAIMFVYASICTTMALNTASGFACATLPNARPNSLTFSLLNRRMIFLASDTATARAAANAGRNGARDPPPIPNPPSDSTCVAFHSAYSRNRVVVGIRESTSHSSFDAPGLAGMSPNAGSNASPTARSPTRDASASPAARAHARCRPTHRTTRACSATSWHTYGPRRNNLLNASSGSRSPSSPGSDAPPSSPRPRAAAAHPAGAPRAWCSRTASASDAQSAARTVGSSAGSSPRFDMRSIIAAAESTSPAASNPRRRPNF